MVESFAEEFRRYRVLAEKSLAQMSDAALNHVPAHDANSAAMLVRHMSGNLVSRFTDFLTSDGEKTWRNRDGEFEEREYSREEIDEMWRQAWSVLDQALDDLSDADLQRAVRIRGEELTVHAALARALAHLSYHAGQIVLLARMERQDGWEWLSVPKGKSVAYNQNPTRERTPG